MDQKRKTNTLKSVKKNGSGGLYIALAICILSAVCVGVYGAVLGLVKPMTGTGDESGKGKAPQIVVETPEPSKTVPRPTVPAPTEKAPPAEEQKEPEQSAGVQPEPVYTLPLVGSVIKDYSNELLVYSETMNDYRQHNGMDLAAVIGERVYALTDGVVEKVYDDVLMGKTVVLDHGNGLKSVYQNLVSESPEGITEGAAVKSGQVIGGVGETAMVECALEPHLHFEVWKDGAPVDPKDYLP